MLTSLTLRKSLKLGMGINAKVKRYLVAEALRSSLA